jgi:hypothetical protein
MIYLTGDMGKSASYTRREYAVLAGLDFGDGRAATVIFNHFSAQTRLGRKSHTSRYAVSEVREVGFNGRVFVWDKEEIKGVPPEHGEARPNDRKPPYTVRMDNYGEIWCECMAGVCKAPVCRHCDCTLILLDEGVFSEELVGA